MQVAVSHASATARAIVRAFPCALAATIASNSNAADAHETKKGQTAAVGPGENGLSQGKVTKTKTKAIEAVMGRSENGVPARRLQDKYCRCWRHTTFCCHNTHLYKSTSCLADDTQ